MAHVIIEIYRVTLLLNWYANPYHTPIFVAQQLGFYSAGRH